MSVQPNRNTLLRRKHKLACVEIETTQRWHAEHFRVLTAISELLPRSGDTDGRATSALRVADLAAHAGVSGKAVDRSLAHWRAWRVLWLFWKGDHVWDIRFDRTVVETLLTTRMGSPHQVGHLLIEHRRQREAVAPLRLSKNPLNPAAATH
jgi:hypothetical protein